MKETMEAVLFTLSAVVVASMLCYHMNSYDESLAFDDTEIIDSIDCMYAVNVHNMQEVAKQAAVCGQVAIEWEDMLEDQSYGSDE